MNKNIIKKIENCDCIMTRFQKEIEYEFKRQYKETISKLAQRMIEKRKNALLKQQKNI
ncbi:MAG: hypothetical protein WC678_02715 [Parcubacteria group bacterium]|jgi:hypothetical protein